MMDKREYLLGLYEKSMPHSLSIREKLVHTKNAGFDYLEISIDESDEKLERLKWGIHEKQELVRATWETGIPIISMCLSGHRKYPLGCEDKVTREKGMEIMHNAIRFAADTGIRIIQIAGYDEYYNPSSETTKQLFLENLGKSVEMAASCGVILAFETMETGFMNTVGKAMYYINRIDSPYLQIYPDLGNITNAACLYGHAITNDMQSGRGHLAAMHLKETVPGKYREIPFGTGHVDFTGAIKTARNMGVRLFVAEFWHNTETDWLQQLTFANEFIRSKFNN
jgi:predicted hexulose-6-phosphate isomerase